MLPKIFSFISFEAIISLSLFLKSQIKVENIAPSDHHQNNIYKNLQLLEIKF